MKSIYVKRIGSSIHNQFYNIDRIIRYILRHGIHYIIFKDDNKEYDMTGKEFIEKYGNIEIEKYKVGFAYHNTKKSAIDSLNLEKGENESDIEIIKEKVIDIVKKV